MLRDLLKAQACVVRSGYAQAIDEDGKFRSEKDLRDLLKARFTEHPLGSWAIHCATREALAIRRATPDGRAIFGGKAQFERRRKGLISNEEWRRIRHSRPIDIVGDRTRQGNRHLTLSQDGLTAEIEFLGRKLTLHLEAKTGKHGKLVQALAMLMEAGEIGVGFTLGLDTLSLTFDPMDLRKLPAGMTLEAVKIAEQGKSRRGRKRKDPDTHYAAARIRPVDPAIRPVHPEWRQAISTMTTRAVGVDLNPEWIGLTVIEIPFNADARDVDAVRILDHRLIELKVPIDASAESMATVMARCARMATSLARQWHAATIFHEDGLGKLAWSKKRRHGPKLQTVNYWSRNAFIGGLGRRCLLAGVKIQPIWGGYSTTIGNMCFDLPDACAAAAEIARRGIAAARGEKDRLPAVPPMVHTRRGKDGKVPDAVAKAIANADSWVDIHRAIKAAKDIGYRRLHPKLDDSSPDPGRPSHGSRGFAVHRHGSRKSGWITVAKPPTPLAA